MKTYISFSLQKWTHHQYSSSCYCIQFCRQAGKEAGGGYRRGLYRFCLQPNVFILTQLYKANVITNSVVALCYTSELSIRTIKEEEDSFLDDLPHKTEIILVQTLLCWLMLRIRSRYNYFFRSAWAHCRTNNKHKHEHLNIKSVSPFVAFTLNIKGNLVKYTRYVFFVTF